MVDFNDWWWVLVGLGMWGFSYWVIWDLKPNTIGHLLYLVLGALPNVAAVLLWIAAGWACIDKWREWKRRDVGLMVFYTVLGIALVIFYFRVPRNDFKEILSSKADKRVFPGGKVRFEVFGTKRFWYLVRCTSMSVVLLAIAIAAIFIGWQVLQGVVMWWIVGAGLVVVYLLIRWKPWTERTNELLRIPRDEPYPRD